MITRVVFLTVAVFFGVLLFRLLRAGRVREKYAALWIVVGTAIILLAVWPNLLNNLADWTGVALPVNLLFFLAIILLLGVSMHLSSELSRLEGETRVLAERVALLSLQVQTLEGVTATQAPPPEELEPPASAEPHETRAPGNDPVY